MKLLTFDNGVLTAGIAVSSQDADAHFVDFVLLGETVTLPEVIEDLLAKSPCYHYSAASFPRKLLFSIDGSSFPGAALCLIKYAFAEESVEIGGSGLRLVSVGDNGAGLRFALVLITLDCCVKIVRNDISGGDTREPLYEIRNSFGRLYLHHGKAEGVWIERDSRLYARLDSDSMLRIVPDYRDCLQIKAELSLLSSSGWETLRYLTTEVDAELVTGENGQYHSDLLMPEFCARRQLTKRLMELAELLYGNRLSNPMG